MPNNPNKLDNITSRILFPEISYQITGLCFEIHNQLGRFAREKQYADELEKLFQREDVSYIRELELSIISGSPLGNRIDFLVDEKIIVELKAKKIVTKDDYQQVQRYLQASGYELGIIYNFGSSYLSPKRILNTAIHSDHS